MPFGGQIDAIQILLQCDAKVNQADNFGETALWYAVRSNETKTVKYLLDKGASIETDNDGWSIIDLAVGNGNVELTSLFLNRGLDINCKDPFAGQSLLHLAVNQDRPLMVKYLLQNGASITQRNNLGQTPLEHARDPGINSMLAEAVIVEFTEK